ncbi:DUF1302 domain-containing protein [Endozoicomonas ascidiicola]|uniref:DUF1302 domain-containing protein n=1 Tax=Endozoicomonas ascidiicola TaxID=1698521 RepID=UPI000830F8B6|nr:DUF1302 family protein [Endozoicomonas ascidiicola]
MLTPQKRLQLAPAAAGFVLTGAIMMGASSAYAYEFEAMDGEVQGTLNTTISLGAKYDLEGYVTPDGNEQLENDGDRSFEKGFVSKALKLTSELDLKKDNYGFYGRATAFYDYELMKGADHWQSNNDKDMAAGLDDESGTYSGLSDKVKDNQGRGAKLQSAYLYGNWSFDGGQKLSVKVGEQTHNWGETIFYGGGLMDLNAYDVALSTLPGSDGDLKLAQGMISADFQFNDEMTLSGFIQYDWEESIMPGRGTYGSGEDIFVPGSDFAHYDLQSFANIATGGDVGVFKTTLNNINAAVLGANSLPLFQYEEAFIRVADTSGTSEASNSGQWGVNFTYAPESLENTEFAFYYANYHSSLPTIDVMIDDDATLMTAANAVANAPDSNYTLGNLYLLNNATYARTSYAEDIKIWGASFNTTVFGYTQIAGELTYTENSPIWIDHPEDLLAKALFAGNDIIDNGEWDSSHVDSSKTAKVGEWFSNYETAPVWDASLSVIQPFGAVLGTDLLYVVTEAAFEQVSGLDDYDRYVAKGSSDWAQEAASVNADDRLDRFSWGYNLMVGANWNDVAISGLNLESTFRFTHDVSGNSHMTGRFEEGEKKINLGLTAKYDDMTAKLAWGGDADNVLRKGTITGTVGYTF